MIKALIRKELRENFKVAVLALAVFTLVAVGTYSSYSTLMDRAARGLQTVNLNTYPAQPLQPLLSSTFLMQLAGLCGIFGAVLGWLQIHHERNRDLWAFLIHRPVTRTQVFLAKIAAGLGLYLLATGVPLAGFFIWCRVPGHVAAPFEWGMALPALKIALAGTACYFAGMLTSLREARWYGSRGFGLALALVTVLISMGNVRGFGVTIPFWGWALAALSCTGVLGFATWGGFLRHGEYRGQPVVAKLALTLTVSVGSMAVLALAFAMISNVLRPENGGRSWSSYAMSKDGTIYRMIIHPGSGPRELIGLDGKPFLSDKTGLPAAIQEFRPMQAVEGSSRVNFGDQDLPIYYQDEEPFFVTVWSSPDTMWYFWRKSGRIVGYNIRSRRAVASLGPNGFVEDLAGKGDRFDATSELNSGSDHPWRILQTPTAAYWADLDGRTIHQIFTTTEDESIGGTTTVGPNRVIVITRHVVHVLFATGHELMKLPYQPGYPNYGIVRVYALEPAGQFAVWFAPTVSEEKQARLGLHTHVTWLAADGTVTKAADIPDLPRDPPAKPWLGDTMSCVGAPLIRFAAPGQFGLRHAELAFSLLGTLASIVIGWRLGGRYCIGRRAQTGWAVFHLMFNLPGLLTFLCVQEWPAREACPKCGKRRVVDRELCEHCGAEFAAPARNGTEIFEPAES